MKNSTRTFLLGVTRLENKYQPKFVRVITAFRSRFIADLEAHGMDYARSRLGLAYLNPELTQTIQQLYREAGLFGARLTASELKGVLTRKDLALLIRHKAGGFGKNERWIQAVTEFLRKHLLKFVSAITDTMREDILNLLDRSVKHGISINDIVGELKRKDLAEARARVIARTETVRAANVGHSVAAKETSFEVNKQWNAARDHRTRHSHREVHGHVVGEDETFRVAIYKGEDVVGHDNMLYPGDATAHVSNTVNCRCRATYQPKRDSQGNLIMREQTGATIIPIRTVPEMTPAEIAAQLKKNIQIVVE